MTETIAINSVWMTLSCLLVIMMIIPGLALFYGGLARRENILSTMSQIYLCMFVTSVLWVVIGYSLSTSPSTAWWGGTEFVFLHDALLSVRHGIPLTLDVVYNIAYASFAVALIYGAVQDRVNFTAYLLFTPLWLLLVYCPIYHMIWGDAGLSEGHNAYPLLGRYVMNDFAGGLVVQVTAGMTGLVIASMISAPYSQVSALEPKKDYASLSMIGAAFMWLGWFGFTSGSTYIPDMQASLSMLNTHLSASIGGLTWMVLDWIQTKQPRIRSLLCGIVSGLVAITPGAGLVDIQGAILISGITTLITFYVSQALARGRTHDHLHVFSIHCIGGVCGALLATIFMNQAISGTAGLMDGNITPLIAQAIGCALVLLYSAVASCALVWIVNYVIPMKATLPHVSEGLDSSLHGEVAQD